MGKYTKKHAWMPCEFVYKINSGEKKAGDTCGVLTRVSWCDKYYCWYHSPRRLLNNKLAALRRNIKFRAKEESRMKASQEMKDLLARFENKLFYEKVASSNSISTPNLLTS